MRFWKLWLTGLLLTGLLLFIPFACGQVPVDTIATVGQGEGLGQDTLITGADLFEESDPLHLTLTLNLKNYEKTKYKGEYIPVELTYQVNDTLSLNRSVRIKARGNFRRQYCQLSPFWLNIKSPKRDTIHSESGDTIGPKVNKIKIVTHCRNNTQYDNYVLREYLAYRIYNLLSPVSFRVRLIRMTYVDTGRKDKETEHWSFMIEPEEMLAERFGALVVKNDQLNMQLMNPEEFDLVALYIYMIGNSDFSITGRHNAKILGLPGFGSRGYTPVPYDFDYSGLVDAYYAVPGENLGIESVRDRYFLGLCREDDKYQKAIDSMNNHRDEILELINTFPYLDEKEKNDLIGYLESYFDLASDPARLINILNRTCR
ncbi:MAG: hypothetical protein ACWGNV_06785 [Bacteroidales bacterium]